MNGFHFLADSLPPGGRGGTFYFVVFAPAASPWYVDICALYKRGTYTLVSVMSMLTSVGVGIAKIPSLF